MIVAGWISIEGEERGGGGGWLALGGEKNRFVWGLPSPHCVEEEEGEGGCKVCFCGTGKRKKRRRKVERRNGGGDGDDGRGGEE